MGQSETLALRIFHNSIKTKIRYQPKSWERIFLYPGFRGFQNFRDIFRVYHPVVAKPASLLPETDTPVLDKDHCNAYNKLTNFDFLLERGKICLKLIR